MYFDAGMIVGSNNVGTFSLSLDDACVVVNGSPTYPGLVGVTGMSSEDASVETVIVLMGVLKLDRGLREEVGVEGTREGSAYRTKRLPTRYHWTTCVDAFE